MKELSQNILDYDGRYDEEVRADKIQLLYKQSISASIISAVTATLLASILLDHIDRKSLYFWYWAIIFTAVGRGILFVLFYRSKPEGNSILYWEKIYLITLFGTALVWGIGCVYIMSEVEILYQTVIYLFLFGMVAGSISAHSTIFKAAMVTSSFMIIPAIVWFLSRGELTRILLGVAGTLLLVGVARGLGVMSKAIHQSFVMKYVLLDQKRKSDLMAKTDSLTGLNNRRAFYELAESEIRLCQRYGNPVSVLLLDIDFFKQVNDTYGHAIGDLTLQHIARYLGASIRGSDFCGRFGGEEFVVFVPHTDMDGALKVAEKIRSEIDANPLMTPNGEISVTVSIGVATGSYDIEQLLKMADTAMYQAKESGRNRVVYN